VLHGLVGGVVTPQGLRPGTVVFRGKCGKSTKLTSNGAVICGWLPCSRGFADYGVNSRWRRPDNRAIPYSQFHVGAARRRRCPAAAPNVLKVALSRMRTRIRLTQLSLGCEPSAFERLPLGQRGRAAELVGLAINEMACLGKVVVD